MIPQNFTRFPVCYRAQRMFGELFHARLIPPYKLRRFGRRGVVLIYMAGKSEYRPPEPDLPLIQVA